MNKDNSLAERQLIEVAEVDKVYISAKQRFYALKEVSLNIKQGDYLALVGPSGAGKSTLLHILGGIDCPAGGSVKYKGKNIYQMNDKQLSSWRAAHIGFVFQFYHLIEELTVLENVTLALNLRRKKYALKTGLELLEYLGIENRKGAFPSQLSGGERQKTALARALANDPDILLCDEPTGNLDSDSQAKVAQLLCKLNKEKGKTIILVTHNLELAKSAKNTLFLKNGQIVINC